MGGCECKLYRDPIVLLCQHYKSTTSNPIDIDLAHALLVGVLRETNIAAGAEVLAKQPAAAVGVQEPDISYPIYHACAFSNVMIMLLCCAIQ